ncbi:hypothetical protein [Mangrovimonas sp. YM274]|uniref:hypothetical protein n=1 Tax=Mangrovimonas sp. YM274 TaxID=3070660 RepID=UPI0027DE9124|nr:hypothetical protein [Mangrovimonas sp. YM274]WMI68175.1 hypothetical protein RBH95_13600 [Mangrovimonas sp. YM274]
MKKTLQILLLVFGLTYCQAQEVKGIWMSYQNYIIDINSMVASGNEGFLIDFDNQTIGTIHSDSVIPLKIDFKKSKLFMTNDTLNVDFKIFQKDSIEIDFGQNMMHVFRPLNLNHKLNTDKKTIQDFLTKNRFEKINGELEIEFSDKFFFRDLMFEKPNKKNALINKSWDDEGYWFIKEINQNFFLIFTLSQIDKQNIYQLISINKCKIELKQLQKADFGNGLTELKTCL